MHDFESLMGELLQNHPELTREELLRRVEEKKRTVGAGYLTSQGALFLVASEMGVSLRKEETVSDMTVKDLYIGANDVTVTARVLAVYPEASYNKKDGGTGRYRRLVLFDGDHTAKMTVWEERLGDIDKLGVVADSLVRVVSGYVKQGLDGKPSLNLGKRGRIEVVPEDGEERRLPRISDVVLKLPVTIDQERQFAALEGRVTTDPRYSEFVRQDGSQGSMFQFGMSAPGGSGEVRVVVWNPSARPALKVGQAVVVTNVRSRRGTNGGFELHGDSGSTLTLLRPPRMELRVAAVLDGSTLFLGVDRDRRVHVVETSGGSLLPEEGQLVSLNPDVEVGGRIRCADPESIEEIYDDSYPALETLSMKLSEMKEEGALVMVGVIALSRGEVATIRLKDGSTAERGEVVVGDDSAEMKVVGWRELAGRVAGVQPGERLRVVGAVSRKTKTGAWELQVSPTTAITRTGSPA